MRLKSKSQKDLQTFLLYKKLLKKGRDTKNGEIIAQNEFKHVKEPYIASLLCKKLIVESQLENSKKEKKKKNKKNLSPPSMALLE